MDDDFQTLIKDIQAEHLSFPLQAPARSVVSSSELIAKFKVFLLIAFSFFVSLTLNPKPTTELETSIEKLLKKANLLDSQRGQGPDNLPANIPTAEAVLARTSEVRKMRELAFRADTKAKRLAKIKSKTYRRLKKKQKQKLTEKLDTGEDSADNEEKQLQHEVERAKERATLRHKNVGKWAKTMKTRGELDEDQRQEVLEMLQRGEKLRRKIHAEGDEDEDEVDDDADDETGDEEQIRASAFDEVARIVEEDRPDHPKKSLFNMKFMKDAIARDDKKAQDMADEFLEDLAGSGVDIPSDDPQSHPERISGRFSFRPGAQVYPAVSFSSEYSRNIIHSHYRLNSLLWDIRSLISLGMRNLLRPFHRTPSPPSRLQFPPSNQNPLLSPLPRHSKLLLRVPRTPG